MLWRTQAPAKPLCPYHIIQKQTSLSLKICDWSRYCCQRAGDTWWRSVANDDGRRPMFTLFTTPTIPVSFIRLFYNIATTHAKVWTSNQSRPAVQKRVRYPVTRTGWVVVNGLDQRDSITIVIESTNENCWSRGLVTLVCVAPRNPDQTP